MESILTVINTAKTLNMSKSLFYYKIRKKHLVIPAIICSFTKKRIGYHLKDVLSLKESISKGGFKWDDVPSDGYYISAKEAAEMIGIKKETFHVLRSKGRLTMQKFKINGKVRYLKSDIEQYISENKKIHS